MKRVTLTPPRSAWISFALAGIALLAIGCDKSESDLGSEPDLDDPKEARRLYTGKILKRGPVGEQLAYAPNEQKPYTGWVKSMHSGGQVLQSYKDGKKEGLATWWFSNGQKQREGTWKDGKIHGLWTEWDENGNVTSKVTWKDGKLVL